MGYHPYTQYLFLRTGPVSHLIEDSENGLTLKELFSKKNFWSMFLLMICAGASEQAVSQWASTFAEKGLKVNKFIGDLASPIFFALMMGLSRTLYGKWGEKINLEKMMLGSGILRFFSPSR